MAKETKTTLDASDITKVQKSVRRLVSRGYTLRDAKAKVAENTGYTIEVVDRVVRDYQ